MRWLLIPAAGLLLAANSAHLALRSSTPAAGDTVRTHIHSVDLAFTQAVELRYTAIVLTHAAGHTIDGTLQRVSSDSTARLQFGQPLSDGAYRVAWRTAGADGHVVRGEFGFVVAGVSAGPAPAGPAPPPAAGRVADQNQQPIPVLLRWLNLASLLLMAGAVAFMFLLRARGPALAPEFLSAVYARARTIALAAGLLSLVLAAPRLLLQSAMLHGSENMLDLFSLGTLVRETNWGRGWVLQLLGTIGFLFALIAAESVDSGAWLLAGASTVVAAFGPPFTGHAAAIEQSRLISIGADAVHILAAGLWLGSLACVLIAALTVALRQRAYDGLALIVRAFSPLALIGAATLAVTGTVAALANLGPLTDLFTTDYGRALGFKLLAIGATALTGLYNWKRVTPALGTETGARRLNRSAGTEIGIALLVLLITAVLVALPLPNEPGATP